MYRREGMVGMVHALHRGERRGRDSRVSVASSTLVNSLVPRSGVEEKDIQQPPREGVYVKGIYLEGAGWDADRGHLCEPEPMRLIEAMPIIHFKPAEVRRGLARHTPSLLPAARRRGAPYHFEARPRPGRDGRDIRRLLTLQVAFLAPAGEEEGSQGRVPVPAVHQPGAHGDARAAVVHDLRRPQERLRGPRALDQARHGAPAFSGHLICEHVPFHCITLAQRLCLHNLHNLRSNAGRRSPALS